LGEKETNPEKREKLLNYGRTFANPSPYSTPADAKTKGGKKGLMLTSEELQLWDQLSLQVQDEICDYKFENENEVRDNLCATKGKLLVHPAMRCSAADVVKRRWEGRVEVVDGKIVVKGGNKLGEAWMKKRESSCV